MTPNTATKERVTMRSSAGGSCPSIMQKRVMGVTGIGGGVSARQDACQPEYPQCLKAPPEEPHAKVAEGDTGNGVDSAQHGMGGIAPSDRDQSGEEDAPEEGSREEAGEDAERRDRAAVGRRGHAGSQSEPESDGKRLGEGEQQAGDEIAAPGKAGSSAPVAAHRPGKGGHRLTQQEAGTDDAEQKCDRTVFHEERQAGERDPRPDHVTQQRSELYRERCPKATCNAAPQRFGVDGTRGGAKDEAEEEGGEDDGEHHTMVASQESPRAAARSCPPCSGHRVVAAPSGGQPRSG